MTSAIIINYKAEDLTVAFVNNELGRCKESLEEAGEALSIVVVDNASTGRSRSTLEAAFAGRKDVVIVPMSENVGFARANNAGAAAAILNFAPDVFLFTNNDIHIVDADILNVLKAKLQAIPEAGVIGPCVTGLDGRRQSPMPFQSFTKRHIELYWDNLFMTAAAKKKRLQLDYSENACEGWHYLVSGCFFMVKADAWKACEGMDPNTFLYSEEAILSERMKSAGYGVWYTPEVSVVHEHGRTTGQYYDNAKVRDLKFESEAYYYRHYIHTPSWQIWLGRLTLNLKKLLRR